MPISTTYLFESFGIEKEKEEDGNAACQKRNKKGDPPYSPSPPFPKCGQRALARETHGSLFQMKSPRTPSRTHAWDLSGGLWGSSFLKAFSSG